MVKVLVVTGGNSSEREISLISAESIQKALEQAGFHSDLHDFNSYSKLKKVIKDYQIVFPIMHGRQGEDGTLYLFLKLAKMPFVGSDPKGAKIGFNKILSKKYFEKKKIPTAEWKILRQVHDDILKFGLPCVLKAANGGSSREVALIYSKQDLKNKLVDDILCLDDQFYVERLLKGTEITVGVLGDQVLPVVEIVPPKKGWFDYQNKYSGESREIPFAPSVKSWVQKQAQEIALKIHQELKLRSFSRTDIIVVDDIPYVLEVNTPNGVGMTSESLFPKAAKAAGIEFPELMKKLVELGLSGGFKI